MTQREWTTQAKVVLSATQTIPNGAQVDKGKKKLVPCCERTLQRCAMSSEGMPKRAEPEELTDLWLGEGVDWPPTPYRVRWDCIALILLPFFPFFSQDKVILMATVTTSPTSLGFVFMLIGSFSTFLSNTYQSWEFPNIRTIEWFGSIIQGSPAAFFI